MKNLYYCVLLCLLGAFTVYSQGENNNWYFGEGAGVNFATVPPTVLPNSNMGIINNLGGNGSSASISDSNGQTLFYSNGTHLYDKSKNVMLNGTFPVGGGTNQSALFVPHPGDPNLYYFFLTRGAFRPCTSCTTNELPRFSYTLIDKRLNNGNGGIVITQRDVLLHNFPESSITIAKTNSGDGYWILNSYHDYWDNKPKFGAIKIDGSGINPAVIAVIPNFLIHGGYGNGIKVSPDNNKVAIFDSFKKNMKVFTFNSVTGTLSNEVIACTDCLITSVEFSSDSNLLYTTSYSSCLVYNLQGTQPVSRMYVNSAYNGLQRAVDGNIYLTKGGNLTGNESMRLYKILNQNSFLNSSIDSNSILVNRTVGTNLPQFIPSLQQPCESITLTSETNLGAFSYQNKSNITTKDNYILNSPNQNISMSAQNFIILKPNTEIKGGAKYEAKIRPCVDIIPMSSNDRIIVDSEFSSQNESVESLKLYPNPNNGSFTIELQNADSEKVSFEVFDSFGKSVFVGYTIENHIEVNLPNLSSGLYLVKVQSRKYDKILKFIKK